MDEVKDKDEAVSVPSTTEPAKRKRGRPKGSKNKPKAVVVPPPVEVKEEPRSEADNGF